MNRKARIATEISSTQRLLTIIAASPSRNEKIELLRKYDSEVLRDVLFYAYNPFITYGIVNITKNNSVAEGTKGEGVNWGEMKDLLIKLSSREYTGNIAREKIADLLISCTLDQTELFLNILQKDLRCGVNIKTINVVFPKLIPEFNVMLAEVNKPIQYPCYVEPKLDGVRTECIIENSVRYFSRNGKVFENFNLFDKELQDIRKKLGGEHLVFDAEVVGTSFDKLMTMVRRKHNLIESNIQLWIFDYVKAIDFNFQILSSVSLKGRKNKLLNLELQSDLVKIVPHVIVNNEEELMTVYKVWLEEGFEGVVIKNPNSSYQYKRTVDWIKLKPTDTLDLEITGVEEGTGKYVGKLGALVVDYKGVKVNVGSGYVDEQRIAMWKTKSSLIGKVAEVKYQDITKDGSLRFPVFIRLREDKEL